jgi:hypothetical protein
MVVKLILRDQHNIQVFENIVHKKISAHKRNEMKEHFSILHNEKLL